MTGSSHGAPVSVPVQVKTAAYHPGLGGKAPPGTHGGPTVTVTLSLPPAEGLQVSGTVKVVEPVKQVVVTVTATATFAPQLSTQHHVANAHRDLVLKVNRPEGPPTARYTLLVKDTAGKDLFRTVFVNVGP